MISVQVWRYCDRCEVAWDARGLDVCWLCAREGRDWASAPWMDFMRRVNNVAENAETDPDESVSRTVVNQ